MDTFIFELTILLPQDLLDKNQEAMLVPPQHPTPQQPPVLFAGKHLDLSSSPLPHTPLELHYHCFHTYLFSSPPIRGTFRPSSSLCSSDSSHSTICKVQTCSFQVTATNSSLTSCASSVSLLTTKGPWVAQPFTTQFTPSTPDCQCFRS